MKFNEKYPQLKDKQYLTKLLTGNVYATMSLEDQQVPMAKVEEIVKTAIEKKESQDGQLLLD